MVNPSVCLKESKNRLNGAGSVITARDHHHHHHNLSLPPAFSPNELEDTLSHSSRARALRAPPLLAIYLSLDLTRSER